MQHSRICKNCRRPTMNASGYCDACAEAYQSRRKANPIPDHGGATAQERGYNNAWTIFARAYLRDHPTCAICGAPATCVDHRDMTAHEMMGTFGHFILEEKYYQPLCTRCNTRKGAREDRRRNESYDRQVKELSEIK